ncbi:MAG TPA: twin-arginine translocase TatA/TatE family subunit [Terriglobales bacterium]|jgi:sec-independent protein translocase protein TatB|nr:twin-arginine translocase TatA/TatE family subunit [Terriglobales bacterium]
MDLGMPELIFIFLIALLIFGPAQLPKLGRQLGKALGEFKRASNDFKHQLEDEVHKLELEQLKEEARKSVGLEPPEGTVAKENVDYSKLSHQAAWEHGERKIQPPAAQTQADGAAVETAKPEAAAGESPASTRVTGDHVA